DVGPPAPAGGRPRGGDGVGRLASLTGFVTPTRWLLVWYEWRCGQVPELFPRICLCPPIHSPSTRKRHAPPPRPPSARSPEVRPMSHAAADRNLLFGILALQMDFITRDALVGAMHAWVLDKARPLGEILAAQGALGPDEHALLTALVHKHLERHGGNPRE